MPADAVIADKVETLIADILSVERHEVTPETLYEATLGGESLSMLEFGFRAEREFGVRVRFQDLIDVLKVEDGMLTDESLEHLKQRFPLLDVANWARRPFNRPLELLTIGDITAIVESEIQRQPAAKAT